MPKKAAKKSAAPKKQTKTSFVLSFPHSLSAKDVVDKGKAAGVSLTDKHVWAIRSDAKKRKSKGSKKAAAPKAPKATKAPKAAKKTGKRSAPAPHRAGGGGGNHHAEALLRTAALALGLPRAMSILQTEHDRMRRLLG